MIEAIRFHVRFDFIHCKNTFTFCANRNEPTQTIIQWFDNVDFDARIQLNIFSTQNELVDIVTKIAERYRMTTRSTLLKPIFPKQNNTNEHLINGSTTHSIKNDSHCERCKNEMQPRKKPPLQWSITSLKSHQIIKCDEITLKVNITLTNRGVSYT